MSFALRPFAISTKRGFAKTVRRESREQAANVINVTLIGPDSTRSVVLVADDATVRDVATSKYDLFSQITKRNGVEVDRSPRW